MIKRMYCLECEKQVNAEGRKNINHILHIILSVLTVGWWLIAYALIGIMSKRKFYCLKCGGIVTSVLNHNVKTSIKEAYESDLQTEEELKERS